MYRERVADVLRPIDSNVVAYLQNYTRGIVQLFRPTGRNMLPRSHTPLPMPGSRHLVDTRLFRGFLPVPRP
jgi:hypothetical protein